MGTRKVINSQTVTSAAAAARELKSFRFPPAPVERQRLVERWRPTFSRSAVDIEVARPGDAALVEAYMMNESRIHEPVIGASKATEGEVRKLFAGICERSLGSGLSLLMFRAGTTELIGIRMTSVRKLPSERREWEDFRLLPDYKQLIDRQPSEHRKEQRILALCDLVYSQVDRFVPVDTREVICQELIGIKPDFRLHSLATRFNHEMYKLATARGLQHVHVLCTGFASQRVCKKMGMKPVIEVPYAKFTDDGEVCFADTPDGSRSAVYMIGNLEKMGYQLH